MTWELDARELRAIIAGKFQFRPCLDCGQKGWVWVDGDAGEIVLSPDPTRDELDFYKDQCDSCMGLGGSLVIEP